MFSWLEHDPIAVVVWFIGIGRISLLALTIKLLWLSSDLLLTTGVFVRLLTYLDALTSLV